MQAWTCVCGQPNWGPHPCSRCLAPAPPSTPVVRASHGASRPGWVFATLAVAIAVLLVAGVGGALSVGREESPTSPPPSSILTSPGGGASPSAPDPRGQLEALIPQLQQFVEQARGLAFKAPVKVTFLADADFRARLALLRERSQADRDEVETAEGVLRALGLLEGDVDLAKAADSLLGAAVAGLYDAEADELVVRGDEPSAQVRATLVHELTHALQDQHFQLHRPGIDERDDEAGQAFTALAEGDAVRIEQLYLESLPLAEQKRVEAEEQAAAAAIGRDVPRVLLEVLAFPYLAGPLFVAALMRQGGPSRVDAAFSSPPTTSEHLLHPETFLAGDGGRPVATPPADGTVIDEGVGGEFGLLLMLSRGLAEWEARDAADGWGGDRYVAWRKGPRTCVRAALVMDSTEASARLAAALRRWADRHGNATVSGSDPVTLTACR
jgi:hypothetical protein